MKLTPYLHFAGNAAEALDFYATAFGGEVTMRTTYGDSPMPSEDDWKDKIMHARLLFGDNLIMLSDSFKGQPALPTGNVQLSMEIVDAAQIETVFNAMAEGGTITMPLQDQFWGAKFGMLTDKFGISWMFNHELKK
ncbi:MAG: glyoxalase/bleomycin resistance/extradiol dioxygenase family protein [Bacteroidota bacterium]